MLVDCAVTFGVFSLTYNAPVINDFRRGKSSTGGNNVGIVIGFSLFVANYLFLSTFATHGAH